MAAAATGFLCVEPAMACAELSGVTTVKFAGLAVLRMPRPALPCPACRGNGLLQDNLEATV